MANKEINDKSSNDVEDAAFNSETYKS